MVPVSHTIYDINGNKHVMKGFLFVFGEFDGKSYIFDRIWHILNQNESGTRRVEYDLNDKSELKEMLRMEYLLEQDFRNGKFIGVYKGELKYLKTSVWHRFPAQRVITRENVVKVEIYKNESWTTMNQRGLACALYDAVHNKVKSIKLLTLTSGYMDFDVSKHAREEGKYLRIPSKGEEGPNDVRVEFYSSPICFPKGCSNAAHVLKSAPRELCCPVTLQMMRSPMVTNTGHTYELSTILELMKHKDGAICSITKQNIHMVIPNYAMRSVIEGYITNYACVNGKKRVVNVTYK